MHQPELPTCQRDLRLTESEQKILADHFGLIVSVAHSHRYLRIPDLREELMLQACRIIPGYDANRGPAGPFLKASLSRYCDNLKRDQKKKCGKEKSETDQCGGGPLDILGRKESREPYPDEDAAMREEELNEWGNQSSWVGSALQPTPAPKPTKKESAADKSAATKWLKRNSRLVVSRWRGVKWAAEQAGTSVQSMTRALTKLGYLHGKRTKLPTPKQGELF